jgi:hypothetical protein
MHQNMRVKTYQEPEGKILSIISDEQTLERMLDNLPTEFSLNLSPISVVVSSLNAVQDFLYILSYMHRGQDYIPLYLWHQPPARWHLAGLGKLAVLDSLPGLAITPLACI